MNYPIKTFVFLGSTNSMPMMYALDLHKYFDVIYFVDSDKSIPLHRPECHFPSINYPYPQWIVEFPIKKQSNIALFKSYYANLILKIVRRINTSDNIVFVLNGHFISLASVLKNHGKIICLSHGSDLDEWAVINSTDEEENAGFSKKNNLKILIAEKIKHYKKVCQFNGFLAADKVIYFPPGFSVLGDKVISELKSKDIKCVSRFDASFAPLIGTSREFKASEKKLIIFSGVRFFFNSESISPELSKGNDLIIQGIAQYAKLNGSLEIHFVEKGPDVSLAKSLCIKHGIQDMVVWHKEMPFNELLKLYEISDICFDQLGGHWFGGVGIYALWLGKPTISNITKQITSGCIPLSSPICNASTASEVCEWLTKLNDESTRKDISELSKAFAESFFSINHVLKEISDV